MQPNGSLLWRVAMDTLKRKYDPTKVKDRVEAALYNLGLGALLIAFLFALAIGLVALTFGLDAMRPWAQGSWTKLKNTVGKYITEADLGDVSNTIVDHPLEALAFLILLRITLDFVVAVFLAWRRHAFEATHSSSEFRTFMFDELKTLFSDTLFAEKEKSKVPMAPIPLTKVNVTLPPDIQHEALPTGWSRIWKFLCHPMIESIPTRHWLLKRDTVRWPNRIGFAASKIKKSSSEIDAVTGLSKEGLEIDVVTCRYREDLDTAYSLGYSYYVWFRRKQSNIFRWLGKPAYLQRFESKVQVHRNAKHKIDRDDLPRFLNLIFEGEGQIRTQLGVQALVIFNDYADGGSKDLPKWKVLLQKRSDDVASSPNHFQFVPSGGFESHQTYDGRAFDKFTQALLQHECVLERGLLREFAEEVIGVNEFMENESLDPDDIYREPGIKALRDLYKDNFDGKKGDRAALFTLGISLSLIGFKPEISYLLLIDHPDYFVRHRLRRSEGEAHMIFTWELSKLSELLTSTEHPMVDSSVTMLRLFLDEEHEGYREMLGFKPDSALRDIVGLS
jgi:hypothetical protein